MFDHFPQGTLIPSEPVCIILHEIHATNVRCGTEQNDKVHYYIRTIITKCHTIYIFKR